MPIETLASEPRVVVVHVAICTIEARVFGSSSIKVKDVLDPLHVLLLFFLGQRLLLHALDMPGSVALPWIQEGLLEICLTNVFPSQSLFFWILSIGCMCRHTLSALGRSPGPLLTVFAFPCPRFLLSLGTGLGVPFDGSFDLLET